MEQEDKRMVNIKKVIEATKKLSRQIKGGKEGKKGGKKEKVRKYIATKERI